MADGRIFLGVDGGNTKTVALIADGNGHVIGAGRSGCSDIFNATSADAAMAELDLAVTGACAAAGVTPDMIDSAAFCMAGVDWPDDRRFVEDAVTRRGYGRLISVENDALGALRAGTPDGVGIIVALGTGAAIAARNSDGRFWHIGFWAEDMGGAAMGRAALAQIRRSTLGMDPPTTLMDLILAHFGKPDVETLLKSCVGRGIPPATEHETARLAPLVMDAAAGGDATAQEIVAHQAELVVSYARAAANRVGLDLVGQPLVLTGGLFRHHSNAFDMLIRAKFAESGLRITRPDLQPVVGCLLLAFETAGVGTTPELVATLRGSAPDTDYFTTDA